ncbi:MAG: hypothetical protein ACOYM2_12485, partial [Rectinemataceae bacterium]
SRQDYEWTRNAEMAEAIQEGEKKGEIKGRADGERAKALSDARNLKRLGVATAVIAEATGLPETEVEKL